jgi:phage terminase large subunit
MTPKAKIQRVPTSTLELIQTAKACGVPKESLERFLLAGYVPQPKQMIFHGYARQADYIAELEDIGYGGARGGGKTHCGFAQIAIDDCQMVPNLSVLFLREKAGSAEESMQKLCTRILPRVPHRQTRSIIYFPNGSSIKIGHFQYEKDINQYLSLEYDVIFLEQAEQLSQSKIEEIKTVNRTSIPNFKPRAYFTFNPGGISHSYLKKKFIEPQRKGTETTTRFVFANVADNRKVDRYYRAKLEQLSGWKKKAWLDGDWDIFAGQYFETFNYADHVVDYKSIAHLLTIPDLNIWCALDYGFKHYTVCYLLCEYDGVIYVLDEFAERKQLISQNALGIFSMLESNGVELYHLSNFVAGSDVFAKKGDSGESFADEFSRCGIDLRPANVSRKAGAGKILQMLGSRNNGIEPSIKISSRCTGLIECLPSMMHNPKDPEDVLKVDTDDQGRGGDDWYDAFRYGVMVNNSLGVTI